MKSKEAMAWEVWCKSQEGIDCRNCMTLGTDIYQQIYLENRLRRAFMAGVECGRAMQPEEKRRARARRGQTR